MGKSKTISRDKKLCILDVHRFFQEEADFGVQTPLDKVFDRTANALSIHPMSARRVVKEMAKTGKRKKLLL